MRNHRFDALRSISPRRIYFGWWVSVAGACNMVFSAAPTFQAASVLFKAIEDEFGWSRTVISGVATFGRLGATLLGPVEGWLTDTFGSGRMVLIGFTIGGIGLILFSRITGPIQCYFAFLILSLGFSSGGFTPSLTAANAWMIRQRATAMSIVEGGVSVAGLSVPLIVWGISEFGWRTTVMAMGIIAIIVAPFIARMVGKRPEPHDLENQLQALNKNRRYSHYDSKHDFTAKEAIRTRTFWAISITHALANVSTGAISAHLFLHLTDSSGVGLDIPAASAIIPILVTSSFIFQLAGGIIGDLGNKRILVPFLMLLQAASLIILALAQSFMTAAIFAIVWGIGFGARTPMLLAMRGEYFGRRYFGTIFALSSFPMSIGMMLAPVIVGWSHDRYHTYDWSLYVLAAFCVLASVTALFATRPPTPAARRRLEMQRRGRA